MSNTTIFFTIIVQSIQFYTTNLHCRWDTIDDFA